jgi:16S rRNA (cytosine1402-N4)-methyltransferase
MNILTSSLEAKHFPVMIEEVIKICNPEIGNKIFLDCTFGGGGYAKALLNFPNVKVIALDRDKSAIERAKTLKQVFPKQFFFHNEKF